MVLCKLRNWIHASPKLLVLVKEAMVIQHCMGSIGTLGAALGRRGEGFSRWTDPLSGGSAGLIISYQNTTQPLLVATKAHPL